MWGCYCCCHARPHDPNTQNKISDLGIHASQFTYTLRIHASCGTGWWNLATIAVGKLKLLVALNIEHTFIKTFRCKIINCCYFSLTHWDGTPAADPCTFLTSPIVTLQHQAPCLPNIFEPCVSLELINIGVVLPSNSPFPLSRLQENERTSHLNTPAVSILLHSVSNTVPRTLGNPWYTLGNPWYSFSLVHLSFQDTLRHNLKSLVYTPSTLLVSSLVKVQVSLPYKRILSTTAVIRLILSLLEKLDAGPFFFHGVTGPWNWLFLGQSCEIDSRSVKPVKYVFPQWNPDFLYLNYQISGIIHFECTCTQVTRTYPC